MSRLMSHIVIRLTLVLAIAVGLVGVGFAHRTAAPVDPQLAAFIEIGGTLADLCDDGAPITHWGDTGCEACRLTDGFIGVSAVAHTPLAQSLCIGRSLPGAKVLLAGDGAGAYAARAPPVV